MAKKQKKEKAFMHKKDMGIPRRQNGIPIKKKKAKTELSKHQKQKKKKTLALEKQQEVPLIRMEKGAENNFKKENFFVLERCLNMISHFHYPIFLLNIKRTSAE